MKNYYHILGINVNSDDKQIKSAYRKLSLKFHPDKNNGDEYFANMFKEINEAYTTLIDPNKRIIYDRRLAGTYQETPPPPNRPKDPPPKQEPSPKPKTKIKGANKSNSYMQLIGYIIGGGIGIAIFKDINRKRDFEDVKYNTESSYNNRNISPTTSTYYPPSEDSEYKAPDSSPSFNPYEYSRTHKIELDVTPDSLKYFGVFDYPTNRMSFENWEHYYSRNHNSTDVELIINVFKNFRKGILKGGEQISETAIDSLYKYKLHLLTIKFLLVEVMDHYSNGKLVSLIFINKPDKVFTLWIREGAIQQFGLLLDYSDSIDELFEIVSNMDLIYAL